MNVSSLADGTYTVKAFVWDEHMQPIKNGGRFYAETFDNDETGTIPSYNQWRITASDNTRAIVACDPQNRENKVLKLEDNSASGKIGAVYS